MKRLLTKPHILLAIIMIVVPLSMLAIKPAIKSNLLTDAVLLTPNLGVEAAVSPNWSVEISGNLNTWNLHDGMRWKHWMVQPEARYWFCDALAGHFVAAHALGGKYNAGHIPFAHNFLGYDFSSLRDHRYQGWFAGAGVGYGYSWILGKHWNLEAELGVGVIHTKYDIFECEGCGKRVGNDKKTLFLPTKTAINLVYLF